MRLVHRATRTHPNTRISLYHHQQKRLRQHMETRAAARRSVSTNTWLVTETITSSRRMVWTNTWPVTDPMPSARRMGQWQILYHQPVEWASDRSYSISPWSGPQHNPGVSLRLWACVRPLLPDGVLLVPHAAPCHARWRCRWRCAALRTAPSVLSSPQSAQPSQGQGHVCQEIHGDFSGHEPRQASVDNDVFCGVAVVVS